MTRLYQSLTKRLKVTKMREHYYYIQRLEYRREPSFHSLNNKGNGHIRTFVEHDYMGSSEFEWGSVPAAWAHLIHPDGAGLVFKTIPREEFSGTRDLHFLCRESDAELVRASLLKNCDLGARLLTKEYTRMDIALHTIVDPVQRLWIAVDHYTHTARPKHLSPVVFGTSAQELMVVLMCILARQRHEKDIQQEARVFDEVYWPKNGRMTKFKVAGDMDDKESGVPLFHLKYYSSRIYVPQTFPIFASVANTDMLTGIVGADRMPPL